MTHDEEISPRDLTACARNHSDPVPLWRSSHSRYAGDQAGLLTLHPRQKKIHPLMRLRLVLHGFCSHLFDDNPVLAECLNLSRASHHSSTFATTHMPLFVSPTFGAVGLSSSTPSPLGTHLPSVRTPPSLCRPEQPFGNYQSAMGCPERRHWRPSRGYRNRFPHHRCRN